MASVPVEAPAADSTELKRIIKLQRENAPRVGARSAAERIRKLRQFERVVMHRREEIKRAMWDDFRKPPAEVDLSEVYAVVSETRHAARHLRRWMRPHRVGGRLALLGTSSRVLYQPKGVVLILSPWNFPFNLSLAPLASAVAAGNCVILKPSEMTPASSACMKGLLAEVFDESEVAVVEGGVEVSEALLRERFDHIFFTGSPGVGKLVMKAAAEHLASVTLELGGKSPLLVDKTANLDVAARRIAWGKHVNSGQTCIAPDYMLVDEAIREEFVPKLRDAIARLAGEGSRSIIVNERHGRRLRRLFDSAMASGGEVITGGKFGDDERTIDYTVVRVTDESCALMQEEIFGPILPMVTYRTTDEALDFIARREHPLALYIFSRDRDFINEVIARTSAGGTVVNHTLIHFFQLNLPFGGSGHSGLGRGHGFAGFQAFSNTRAILEQHTPISPIEFLTPPYTRLKEKLIELTVKYF
ncbi:MAG TPA: aldehyde dehydrogenase family protein [Thermoanaerobaculia bacterium]|nr:aldehyde dehydrogenase family protein [Thermoanaerobaculia bacterium]